MLSRVADSIYWMNRYVERAENVARFIHVNINLMLDLPIDQANQWLPLVITTGDRAAFESRYAEATKDNVIHFLTFDEMNPNSIVSCLTAARENARTVREVISSEAWEQVNRFYLMVKAAARQTTPEHVPDVFYTSVKMASHLFVGICDTTMNHGEGWHFGRLGRLLERADKTARILDVKYFMLLPSVNYVGSPYDAILWSALLKSASAFEMYRKRHHRVDPTRVAEFLILDRHFPRSINHCLARAEASLRQITGTPIGSFANVAERRLGRLRSDLEYAPIEDIIAQGLHEFLDRLESQLNIVGQAIFSTFFALRSTPLPAI